jgi:hypothetical protein
LPPVAPPSGKLMLQLFLVPGLIVAFLVLAWLVGGWLFGVSYSKKDFLDKLNDPNREVRWRAAEHLAQVLPRDDVLAADGDFARQLALMLEKTLEEARPGERAYVQLLADLQKNEPNEDQFKAKADAEEISKLEPQRQLVSFLAASLGRFTVPVGAPALKTLALQDDGLDPLWRPLRREKALWALANLGENLRAFDKLSAPQKDAILDRLRLDCWDAYAGGDRGEFVKLSAEEKDAALDKLAAPAQPDHADWLRDALRALRKRAGGEPDDMGVGDVLVACARDDDAVVRKLAAHAMNFWRGDAAANGRMEDALAALIQDDGRDPGMGGAGEGPKSLAELLAGKDESPTEVVSKVPGLQVRFNAAAALARLGSSKVRVDVLKDMLDEKYLQAYMVLRDKQTGAEQPDNNVIWLTMTSALGAVAELHRLRPELDLSSLKPGVDALAASSDPEVRTEAEKTRLALNP